MGARGGRLASIQARISGLILIVAKNSDIYFVFAKITNV